MGALILEDVTSTRDKRLALILRRAIADTGLTQAELGERIGRHQTWISAVLLRRPGETIRRLFASEPDRFELLLAELSLNRQEILALSGVIAPLQDNAQEVALTHHVPVFPAGAGPTLDVAEPLEQLPMPFNPSPTHKTIGLRIHGKSMLPYLDDGDVAFITCDQDLAQQGKAVAVYVPDAGNIIAIFVRQLNDGSLLLQSLNGKPDGSADFFTAPEGSRIYGPVTHRLKAG